MKLIPTRDHPHNLDRTAALMLFDQVTADTVYRVRAGYVACVGGSGCSFAETFRTQQAAVDALVAYHTNRRAVA